MNLFTNLLTLISYAPANILLARCLKAGISFDDAERIIEVEAKVEGADRGPWAWSWWEEEGDFVETPWGKPIWRGKKVWHWYTCTGGTRFKVWENLVGEFQWEMERRGFKAWGNLGEEGGWWCETGCGWIGDWRRESMEEVFRVYGGVETENPDLREVVEKWDRAWSREQGKAIWDGGAENREKRYGVQKSRKRQSNYRSMHLRHEAHDNRETA